MLVLPIDGQNSQYCSKEEQLFIRSKIELKESNLNLSYQQISSYIADFKAVCEIKKTPEMSDGHSYSLYITQDESFSYIRIHNGLDGSYQLYGPFKK